MDALKNLIANIPDWVKRMDELSGQIELRQAELAELADSQSTSSSGPGRTGSVRNRGSTESLRPADEPEAYPNMVETPIQQSPLPMTDNMPPPPPLEKPNVAVNDNQPPPSSPSTKTPSALRRQTNQVMAVAQAKARATVRKRNRTDSVISAEGAAPKYRTRSMIIVYYDSYVQSFFEELVKFVSASRNLMRKAKMAAKVAQIKRLAEAEMPDDDDGQDDLKAGDDAQKDTGIIEADAPLVASSKADGDQEDDLPPLKYISTRQMRSVSRTAGMLAAGRPMYTRATMRAAYGGSAALMGVGDQKPDVYDELDKGLEYVQSMCEHAAHQFLRDGDCNDEIENIQRRLGETKEVADKEMERVEKEDPDALKPSDEPPKTRSFRPQSMRRETPGSPVSKEIANQELEVDEGIDDMEEEAPKLVFKSTRMR